MFVARRHPVGARMTVGTANGSVKKIQQDPCRVLLIEDDQDDRMLACRELFGCRYIKDVQTFNDGKELVDYMHAQGFMDHSVIIYTPILMLVDLEMPRKDGLEIIEELKSDPFLNPIPLVVVTGTESPQKLRRAIELGADGVFKKPLHKDMLNRYFRNAWKWPPSELWS
jgi:CheY-like chemotaxis protein